MDDRASECGHCNHSDLGIKISGEGAAEVLKTVDDYLACFAKPTGKCLKCGALMEGILGSFTFGLESGEGFCGRCKWPARALHSPEDDDGMLFNRPFQYVLQYHPDNVAGPFELGES